MYAKIVKILTIHVNTLYSAIVYKSMKLHVIPTALLLSILLKLAVCKQKLHILGMYPKSGDGWTQPFVEYSAELALAHIRENGSILSDYEIVIDWKNTQCNGGIALKEFFDALGKNQSVTYLAVFGGGCAVATSEVAAISFRYGLAQIAYASTAPNLGNKNLYPKFVRGVPSDLNAVPARARFINQHNWKRVAIINEQDPIFVASSHFMETVLDRINVEYRVEDFAPSGTIPLDQQVRTIADNLRGNGYSIIIANMYEDAAILMFCELYKQNEMNLLPNTATWIFLGWFTNQWNNKPNVLNRVGCTAQQIADISNGALGFLVAHSEKNFKGETNNTRQTVSNRSTAELYKEYMELIVGKEGREVFERDSDVHDAYVYDSMWTLALALQGMSDNGTNFTEISQRQILTDEEYFSEGSQYSCDVYQGMLSQDFIGWSGKVEYDGHERFYDQVQILEFVNGSLVYRGDCVNIPYYNDYTDDTIKSIDCYLTEDFSYWDEGTASDGITDTQVPAAILCITILLSVVVVVYVTFLIVAIVVGRIQNLKSIQNSSPILTCIILAGNYLLVLAGVFYISNDRMVGHNNPGFVSNFTEEEATTEVCVSAGCKSLCMFPLSLLLVASSLIFGGMIGKASIIYLLAVKLRFNLSEKAKILILFGWPLIFTCVDVVLMISWSVSSSLVMKSEVQSTGLPVSPFIRIIQCRRPTEHEIISNVFIGMLIVYKSVVVLIGLVMAYNLRNVKKNSLRYWGTITWTMYNMTMFTFVLIISFFLIDYYITKITVISLLVLTTALVTSSITGLPPVYYMFRDPNLEKRESYEPDVRTRLDADIAELRQLVSVLQTDKTQLLSDIDVLKKDNTQFLSLIEVFEKDKTQFLSIIDVLKKDKTQFLSLIEDFKKDTTRFLSLIDVLKKDNTQLLSDIDVLKSINIV